MSASAKAPADRCPATVSPAGFGNAAMRKKTTGPSGSPMRRIQMSVFVFAACPFGDSLKLSILRTPQPVSPTAGASATLAIAPRFVGFADKIGVEIPRVARNLGAGPGRHIEMRVARRKLDLGEQQTCIVAHKFVDFPHMACELDPESGLFDHRLQTEPV